MAKWIDWILAGQVLSGLCLIVSVPPTWRGAAFWLVMLIALTGGPDNPWGKRANGEEDNG